MKFLILFVFCGLAQGQTPPCQSAKLYYGGVLVDEEPHCGPLMQLVNMPTALDDIQRMPWPREFWGDFDLTPMIILRSDTIEKAWGKAADETDGKPPKINDGKLTFTPMPNPPAGNIECWTDAKTVDYMCKDSKGRAVDVTQVFIKIMAEPTDVPAVQDGGKIIAEGTSYSCGEIDKNGELTGNGWGNGDNPNCGPNAKTHGPNHYVMRDHEAYYTCADKNRILLHDENNPPKYWCHKVEP